MVSWPSSDTCVKTTETSVGFATRTDMKAVGSSWQMKVVVRVEKTLIGEENQSISESTMIDWKIHI
jgi:hypothetical protein